MQKLLFLLHHDGKSNKYLLAFEVVNLILIIFNYLPLLYCKNNLKIITLYYNITN
jgi:hypothetical protein